MVLVWLLVMVLKGKWLWCLKGKLCRFFVVGICVLVGVVLVGSVMLRKVRVLSVVLLVRIWWWLRLVIRLFMCGLFEWLLGNLLLLLNRMVFFFFRFMDVFFVG